MNMKMKSLPIKTWLRLLLLLALLVCPLLGGVPASAQDGGPTPAVPEDETQLPDVPESAAAAEMPAGLYEALLAVQPAQPELAALDKLSAGGAPEDAFGFSVALDQAGDTALVGAFGADAEFIDQGAVYVFQLSGQVWKQEAKLFAGDAQPGDRFGISVAISDDGTTALIGADRNDDGANVDEGGAYIFTRSAGVWSQTANLAHNDPANARFGWSVDLSSDGQYALVGAYYADIGVAGTHDGAAHVYSAAAGWAHQQTLYLGNDNEYLGYSVALDGDGSLAVVGRPKFSGLGADSGAVSIFTRSGNTWTHAGSLNTLDLEPGDFFGRSVALSNAGSTLLVGASRTDVQGRADQGAAYVFVHSGGTWNQQARLLSDASGAAGDSFGVSVALSGNGSVAVVGALQGGSPTRPDAGAAFTFYRTGVTWSAPSPLALCTANGDRCGVGVALSSSGRSVLVGADRVDYAGVTNSGLTWVLTSPVLGGSFSPYTILLGSGDPGDQLGASVALSEDGNTALVGAPSAEVAGISGSGAAWVFVRSGPGWRLQARLVGGINEAQANFGYSVALSASGNTALIGAPYTNNGITNSGAAYLFTRSGETWTLLHMLAAQTRAAEDHFGKSVSLNDDGYWVAIGVPGMDFGGVQNQGAVYVRQRDDSGWKIPEVMSRGGLGAECGAAVAISGNGYTVLAGAPGVDAQEAENRGSVFVFDRENLDNVVVWRLEDILRPLDGAAEDEFGRAVAVADNGSTALVGAPMKDVGSLVDVGQAYVFTRSMGNWSQFAALAYPNPGVSAAGSRLGAAVSLTGDGKVALVGAVTRNQLEKNATGAVLPFARLSSTFVSRGWITDPNGRVYEFMGSAVAQSDDGKQLLVGALGAFQGTQRMGSAYVLAADFLNKYVYLPVIQK